MITLSQYFLGNYNFGVSWDELEGASYYTAQLDLGSELPVRNLLSFFFSNLSLNTEYTITISAYNSEDSLLDSGSLTRTTLNVESPDNLDPYIIFTTKLVDQTTTGKEFGDGKPELYNSIYVNCDTDIIYFNSNILEDIDENNIYDPVSNDTGLSSEYYTQYPDGNPKTLVTTKNSFEEDTGTTFIVPDGAEDPFPITQSLYFSLAFYYMDPSDSTSSNNLKCIPESTGTPIFVSSGPPEFTSNIPPGEQFLLTTSKCKVVTPNSVCSDHFITSKDGSRYKLQLEP